MPLILTLLPLLAQVGMAPSLGLPTIDRPAKPNPRRNPIIILPTPPGPLQTCLETASANPEAGVRFATAWAKRAEKESAATRAQAQLCMGTALVSQDDWQGAQRAFTAGLAITLPDDHMLRAELGGAAGDAALTLGDTGAALALLDAAQSEAAIVGQPDLSGPIAVDRARALVALHRAPEAVSALAQARADMPKDPQAWLLSATLSRRQGDLTNAQAQIETAVQLAAADPDVGLEAGVIAVLAGHDEAARHDWQAVINSAPDSAAAKQATAYLAQLAPASTVAKPATAPPATRR